MASPGSRSSQLARGMQSSARLRVARRTFSFQQTLTNPEQSTPIGVALDGGRLRSLKTYPAGLPSSNPLSNSSRVLSPLQQYGMPTLIRPSECQPFAPHHF